MNTDTLKAMAGIVGMLSPALGVVGTFASSFLGDKASGKVAKVTGAVEDASSLFTAVAPFFEKFGKDEDFTQAEVREAIAGFDNELAAYDAEIARQKQGG